MPSRAPMVHPKMTNMTTALVAVLMVAVAHGQPAPAPIDARYRFTVGGIKLRIHTYLGEKGRCRVRNEFEDSDPSDDGAKDDNHHLVSDSDGRVEFIAPFTRLVLHAEHYTRNRNGAGRDVLIQTHDLDLPPALNQTVRLLMRAPARSFRVRVMTADNTPLAGMWLVKDEGACGASESPEG